MFIGRTDAEAETPILWPPRAKSWLNGKDPDAGRDWGQEEKGTSENEMAGWHHWLDGHEFELTPGVGDGQGGLVCCDSWGLKESDTTERLNWTELNWVCWLTCWHLASGFIYLFVWWLFFPLIHFLLCGCLILVLTCQNLSVSLFMTPRNYFQFLAAFLNFHFFSWYSLKILTSFLWAWDLLTVP